MPQKPRGPAHTPALYVDPQGNVIPANLIVDSSGALLVTGSTGGGGSGGSVTVTNVPLPVTGAVDITNDPMLVFGTVDVTVSGATGLLVAAPQGSPLWVTGSVVATGVQLSASIAFPAFQVVGTQGPQGVTGSVALTNWPAVVGVSASADLPVFSRGTLGVSGSLNVYTSGPQAVSGTVSLPSTDGTNGVDAVAWKPLSASTYAPSFTGSFGGLASGSIKASAGNLFSIQCTNRSTSLRYLQVFDAAVGPATGAAPKLQVIVPPAAGSGTAGAIMLGQDFFTLAGLAFSTGITWGFSTTGGSFTAGAAADCDMMAVSK